jgi:dolichyl-phosphate-mannose-protein mannosyltransferase
LGASVLFSNFLNGQIVTLTLLTFMAGSSHLRHRGNPSAEPSNLENDQVQDDEHVDEIFQNPVRVSPYPYAYCIPKHILKRNRNLYEQLLETPKGSVIVVSILTSLAFALRFYKINHPDQVV